MREIKTRKKSKGVKPLEKGVSTGDRMKNTAPRPPMNTPAINFKPGLTR